MAEGQGMMVWAERGSGSADPRSDRHLLQRFIRYREEEAFAVLVRRHGPVVWSSCRRVLGDTAEADDAFQATFLLLARKADGEFWHDSVRNWLGAAAHRQALHIRADEHRRRNRERAVGTLQSPDEGWDRPAEESLTDPLREVTRRELRRLLEAELDELPEKYRAPMVLCYLEGKSNREAAQQLGWAVGSISRRLARARILLRERPRLRNLAVLAGMLGCLLGLAFAFAPRPPADDTVAQVMRHLGDSRQSEPSMAHLLALLESDKTSEVDPERLSLSARHTARLLNSIRGHRPGPWQQQADAANQAALELATAAENRDNKAVLLAARRLGAACADCHANYRSW